MNKIIVVLIISFVTQQMFCGNVCPCCKKNEFANQPTRNVAVISRADTHRIKQMMASTSSKARRIKTRATIELHKPTRKDSREAIERHNRLVEQRILMAATRKRSDEPKDSKDDGKESSVDSKTSQAQNG